MIIVGAKGFAKEVLEILHQKGDLANLFFYDDINLNSPKIMYGKYTILNNLMQAKDVINKIEPQFTIGVGGPSTRLTIYNKFKNIGGKFTSTISLKADIGHYNTIISEGCNITSGVVITNDVSLGIGCLVNLNASIGHDCIIGNFVEICPSVNISGSCAIGDGTFIGTGAIILPKVSIGKGVIIAAGAVVISDVPDFVMVAGIPASIKKKIIP